MATPESAPEGPERPSFFAGALVVFCLALAGVVVALVLRNRELSARVGELEGLVHAAGRPSVPALEGRAFPAEQLFDADGAPTALGELPESHATLLLISSSTCDYCELARPTWDRVARRAAGTHLRVLGLVLDATPLELAGRASAYPLLAPADPQLARRIPGVPAALLLDASGRVQTAVYGGEKSGLERLVEEFLGRAQDSEVQETASGR